MTQGTTVNDAVGQASHYFANGYNCPQAVLQALQAHVGLEDKQLWRTATGLGAGMGRQGLVRGAVTGGCLAVGLIAAQRTSQVSKGNVRAGRETHPSLRVEIRHDRLPRHDQLRSTDSTRSS